MRSVFSVHAAPEHHRLCIERGAFSLHLEGAAGECPAWVWKQKRHHEADAVTQSEEERLLPSSMIEPIQRWVLEDGGSGLRRCRLRRDRSGNGCAHQRSHEHKRLEHHSGPPSHMNNAPEAGDVTTSLALRTSALTTWPPGNQVGQNCSKYVHPRFARCPADGS